MLGAALIGEILLLLSEELNLPQSCQAFLASICIITRMYIAIRGLNSLFKTCLGEMNNMCDCLHVEVLPLFPSFLCAIDFSHVFRTLILVRSLLKHLLKA